MSIGKVVVLARGAMNKEQSDIFKSKIPAGWQPIMVDMNEGDAKVAKELLDAEYLLSQGGGTIPVKLIENAKNLKLIQTSGQSTAHLPVEFALRRKIFVANAGGANAISVAEVTVMLILNLMKRTLQFNQHLRDGKWRGNMDRKSYELYGKTVGVIGFGNVGRRVAKLCFGFGTDIIYHEKQFVPYAVRADFRAKPVSLDELLAQSDIVTLHVPLFAANKAMIGWEQLNKMKPTAFLINTSRGANIDEKALIRALEEKKLAGAGIDVWNPEPPEPNNPLLQMPNVVATPHIGATSWENIVPTFETVWNNVLLVSEGKPPINQVFEF